MQQPENVNVPLHFKQRLDHLDTPRQINQQVLRPLTLEELAIQPASIDHCHLPCLTSRGADKKCVYT
ncbi:hypothetical protein OUZ56_014662 [Daphnia magna]|uniref:Uncharacterized protein n=1 Tax=Daphnia magna TaxID=35525 RepID=A0ABR0AKF4_9CRUS|nr:hypothetical protein OUZ56_014662 [Daphnia magna]